MADTGMGGLRERVAFDAPATTADGYGGETRGWAAAGSATVRWAEFVYAGGGEAVMAERLAGRSVFKVKLRQSAAVRSITSAWRMRHLRTGVAYQIREIDTIGDRHWVWMTVEAGVAL